MLTVAAIRDEPKLTCSALTVRGAVAIRQISSSGTAAALRNRAAIGISTRRLR
jgi:hypothetical protein